MEFNREALEELVQAQHHHCVSLFMPAHRTGPNGQAMAKEDLIRWKNLLRQAEERLQHAGLRPRDIDPLMDPARALSEDPYYWRNQTDGLAAFLAPRTFRTFRVPLALKELVVVAPRFHVKPLLELLEDGRFHILALSQNVVRVIESTRFAAKEVEVEKVPHSLEEALQYDDPEKQTQFRTMPTAGGGPRGAAMYHGHGVGVDDTKDRILRFCQLVDRGITPHLRKISAPLVLAAVESVAAAYRQANTYPQLVEDIIAGNPELLSVEELHDRAWPLAEPILLRSRNDAALRYQELRETARATHALEDALRAAADGRIEVLFVPEGIQSWGTFDEGTRQVVRHDHPENGDEDLLNVAAIRTILSSGTVYAATPESMPGGDPVAALLRY